MENWGKAIDIIFGYNITYLINLLPTVPDHPLANRKQVFLKDLGNYVCIPAEAGIQTILNLLKTLNSLFQGNDENRLSVTFYGSVNIAKK